MHSIVCELLKQQRTNCCISITAAVCRRRVCVYVSARDFACYWRGSIDKNIPISVCLCACGASVCLNKKRTCTSLCLSRVCVCARATHSSVVSLGMPLGRECSPLLLHRTTPSEHVQTSGQPDAGRQPLSSAPGRRGREREREGEWDIRERQREKEGEGHEEDGRIQKTTEVKERGDETGEDERWKTGEQRERWTIKTEL